MISQPKKQLNDCVKTVPFVFYFLLIPTLVGAETAPLDSLNFLLDRTENDAERIDLMLDISETTAQSDNSSALFYAHRAALLAANINNPSGVSKAGNQLGNLYFDAGILDSAAYYFNRSMKYYPPDADAYSLAVGYNNLGAIYLAAENPDSAAVYFQKALEALRSFKSLNDTLPLPGITSILNNLGLIYKEKQDYPAARHYFEKGIESSHNYPKEQRIYARLLNNYGGILTLTGETEDALDSLEKSLRIRQEIEDFGGIISSFSNLSFYYSKDNDLQKAVGFTKDAYHLALQFDAKLKIAANAEMLQSLYEEMGMADSSLKYLKVAGTYREQIKTIEANNELQKQQLLNEYTMKLQTVNKKIYNTRWQLATVTASILGILALLLFLYLRLYKRWQKLHFQKILLTKNAQKLKTRNEVLQSELETVNKKITAQAMRSIQDSSLMTETLDGLQQIKEDDNNPNGIGRLISLMKKTGETGFWKEFEIYFLKTNQEFYKTLNAINPHLNANDRRLSALLKMGLSTKEIAQITGRSIESVNKARFRLRNKLKLTNIKTRLAEFLASID